MDHIKRLTLTRWRPRQQRQTAQATQNNERFARSKGAVLCATLVDLCYSCIDPLKVEFPFTRTGSPVSGQLSTAGPLLPAHVVGWH